MSPADTDVLIVIGEPDPALAEAIDVVWSQVPRPRSRVSIPEPALVDDLLDAAWIRLTSTPASEGHPPAVSVGDRHTAACGSSNPETRAGDDMGGHAGHDMDMGEHAGHGMGAPGDGGHAGHGMDMDMGEHAGHGMGAPGDGGHAGHGMDMDMGEHAGHGMGAPGDGGHAGHGMDMDMGEHAGHDMGGHGMHHGGMVAGLPMARTAQDRDGLDLDTLSLALGPILPGWPTGLVLRTQLQGDVLTDVVLSWTAGAEPTADHADARDPQLTALDHLARFLAVAGWGRAARRARRVRAGLAATDPAVRSSAQDPARRLATQIRRSHALTWSVRRMGRLPEAGGGEHGQGRPRPTADVVDRVHRWCDAVAQPTGATPVMPIPLADLAAALHGTELATARLVVASFAFDRTAALHEKTVAGV
ncbi:hypothetical protein [Modestobacter muralis]|uniref:hypothetical protein n=1 Tax=Modestobacter muralis TaxID=1608614 RepID=UPI001FE570AE|nr:hypothetical protein [Modestobacter muralis]